ncbi:hypothetical protein ACT7DE_08720 [Bacillus paranthracis]
MKNQKWLLHLIYVSAVVNLFIAAYNTILPMYFLHSYSDDGSLYSYALGAEAVFAIIAGIVISKKKNDNPTPASLKKRADLLWSTDYSTSTYSSKLYFNPTRRVLWLLSY